MPRDINTIRGRLNTLTKVQIHQMSIDLKVYQKKSESKTGLITRIMRAHTKKDIFAALPE